VFNTSGHIYINKDVEPEVVLADVYSLKTALFTKDDWREIFLISRASVNDLMSEVEKLRNQNSLLEEEIARNRMMRMKMPQCKRVKTQNSLNRK